MSAAEKLLKKMRASKDGYGQSDFERLYTGFGFEKKTGGNHDTYFHRKYELKAQVARHNTLATGYAVTAVDIIDKLLEKQATEKAKEQNDAKQKS